jgi:hypothetical protein
MPKLPFDGVPELLVVAARLARGVIAMAHAGGMPDSYWHTDRHVTLASEVLGWTPEQAQAADLEDLTD